MPASKFMRSPTATIWPSLTATSAWKAPAPVPSRTMALRIRISACCCADSVSCNVNPGKPRHAIRTTRTLRSLMQGLEALTGRPFVGSRTTTTDLSRANRIAPDETFLYIGPTRLACSSSTRMRSRRRGCLFEQQQRKPLFRINIVAHWVKTEILKLLRQLARFELTTDLD